MPHEIINQKIQELVDALRNNSHEYDVTFMLFVNSSGHLVEFERKTQSDLRGCGYSMKNLRRNWINEIEDDL